MTLHERIVAILTEHDPLWDSGDIADRVIAEMKLAGFCRDGGCMITRASSRG